MQTVDLLDQRRRGVLDVRVQVRRHPAALAFAAGGAAIVLSGGVALVAYRVRTRDARRWRERLEAIRLFWRHPDWIARSEPGVLSRIGRSLLVSVASAAVMALARRGARRAWTAALTGPPARLPAGAPRPAGPTGLVLATPTSRETRIAR
jgi:hypothetical protein